MTRPPCTARERAEAERVAAALGEAGYAAHVESFASRRSAEPWLAAYVGLSAVAALLAYPLPLAAAVLGASAVVLHARDSDGRPLLVRRSCTGTNAVALSPHAPPPDLVVVAPLLQRADRSREETRRTLLLCLQALMLAVPTGGAIAWPAEVGNGLPRAVAAFGAGAAVALVALLLFLHRPPREPDHDRSSAAELLLALAPLLTDRRVWLIGTGAPESGTSAIVALLDEHPEELSGCTWLNLVPGRSGEVVAVSEEGTWRERRADRWLLDAAEEAGAAVRPYRASPTNATPLLARHRRALTLRITSGPEALRVALATAHARLDRDEGG